MSKPCGFFFPKHVCFYASLFKASLLPVFAHSFAIIPVEPITQPRNVSASRAGDRALRQ